MFHLLIGGAENSRGNGLEAGRDEELGAMNTISPSQKTSLIREYLNIAWSYHCF